MSENTKPVGVVAGAGPGNGAARVHRFAEGQAVALLARCRDSIDPILPDLENRPRIGATLSSRQRWSSFS
jgi:hypothetical protein